MFLQAIKPANGPEAIGPYSPAVKLGDFVYVSGQLPAEMNLELRHVVKTTVFMSDLNEFNEFNEAYAEAFTAPYPARSCVQVAALPKGAKVEIECLVIDTLIYEQQMAASSCGGGCGGCGSEGGCGSDCEGCQ